MRGRIFAEGAIANDAGDIYGNSPFRIVRCGAMIIPVERAADAIWYGWRPVEKPPELVCDPDFAWITRTARERDAR